MDDLIAATVSEDGFNFERTLSRDALGIGCSIGRETPRDLPTVAVADNHRIAALETSVDLSHTGRQKALSLLQGTHCTGIDDERAFRLQDSRNPALAGCGWRLARDEVRHASAAADCRQRMFGFSLRYDRVAA